MEAEEFDKAMARAHKLDTNPQITAYLQDVMNHLYPEFAGNFRVNGVNPQEINAFALPNGSVYINSGLLARFENEAQLATVMGHEGAHFLLRGANRQNEEAKSASVFGLSACATREEIEGDKAAIIIKDKYSLTAPQGWVRAP